MAHKKKQIMPHYSTHSRVLPKSQTMIDSINWWNERPASIFSNTVSTITELSIKSSECLWNVEIKQGWEVIERCYLIYDWLDRAYRSWSNAEKPAKNSRYWYDHIYRRSKTCSVWRKIKGVPNPRFRRPCSISGILKVYNAGLKPWHN